MIVQKFTSGPLETNAYVVGCDKTKKAIVIDPAPGSFDAIQSFLKKSQLTLIQIYLTHSHFDHIGDLARLQKEYEVPVFVHEKDAGNVLNPGSDGLPLLVEVVSALVNGYLEDKQEVEIGHLKMQVIETPGHSPGGVCFHIPEQNVLFSGDTLFQGAMGNLSLPTAKAADMWISLERLSHLPSETEVYPGHGPSTTIGHEAWMTKAKEIFG